MGLGVDVRPMIPSLLIIMWGFPNSRSFQGVHSPQRRRRPTLRYIYYKLTSVWLREMDPAVKEYCHQL